MFAHRRRMPGRGMTNRRSSQLEDHDHRRLYYTDHENVTDSLIDQPRRMRLGDLRREERDDRGWEERNFLGISRIT